MKPVIRVSPELPCDHFRVQAIAPFSGGIWIVCIDCGGAQRAGKKEVPLPPPKPAFQM